MTITSSQVQTWLKDRVERAEASIEECRKAAIEHAEAKRQYKVAHANVMITEKINGSTLGEAKATADSETGPELERDVLAEGLYKTAIEAARTHRGALSAAQTYVGLVRSEMELVGKGPNLVA